PDLPEWLCNWVMWLISRDMEDRPADARTALEYFMVQRHKLKGYIPKPTTSVTARAPQQQTRKAPPGVILPGQRAVRAPAGATTGPIVSNSYAEGSMEGARSSTQSLKRVPKKNSNTGVYIILSIIGLCLIGG